MAQFNCAFFLWLIVQHSAQQRASNPYLSWPDHCSPLQALCRWTPAHGHQGSNRSYGQISGAPVRAL